ncbi:MAG: hypothetical protein C5B50_16735 [Verrucomicrobia bacterium]|nr:MAG: hypothetical protein C5B50_16735 [Verrucomicrobiota bacterium]
MPIYEFYCEKCERESEILVRSSNWRGARCPHCGSAKLSKKLSVFASSTAGSNPAPSSSRSNAGCSGCACGAGKHRH